MQWVNHHQIIDTKCRLKDWKSDNGYYELDNNTKYSIAYHLIDKCLYARGAHFGWTKVHYTDYIDYPAMRVELARHWPGHEVILTCGGHRTSKTPVFKSSVDNDSIPFQFRQSSYNIENGCVWLSACLLMNTVDSDISTVMIERYQQDEGKFEWMDI